MLAASSRAAESVDLDAVVLSGGTGDLDVSRVSAATSILGRPYFRHSYNTSYDGDGVDAGLRSAGKKKYTTITLV